MEGKVHPVMWEFYLPSGASTKVSQIRDCLLKLNYSSFTAPSEKQEHSQRPARDSLCTKIVPRRLTTLSSHVDGNHKTEQEVASLSLYFSNFSILTSPMIHTYWIQKTFVSSLLSKETTNLRSHYPEISDLKGKLRSSIKLHLIT